MKIRMGFVSNSSSASYIVNIIGINFYDFCDKIRSQYSFYDYFSVKQMKDRIDHLLERYSDTDENDAMSSFSKSFKEELEEQKDKLSKVDEDNFYEVAKFALDFHQIGVKEESGSIRLSSFTSMHNDFDSGMSDIMKELTLYFMFETKCKVVCEVEHNG